MRDIVLELLKLTIMIVAMLLTRYAIPWLKAKTQNETMHDLSARQSSPDSSNRSLSKRIWHYLMKRLTS